MTKKKWYQYFYRPLLISVQKVNIFTQCRYVYIMRLEITYDSRLMCRPARIKAHEKRLTLLHVFKSLIPFLIRENTHVS